MKRKDITMLIAVAIITGIVSLFISNTIFKVPKNRSAKVPTVNTLPSTLPDIKNDPAYQSFLNSKALDPSQPVQVGNSQNNTPFNSSSE